VLIVDTAVSRYSRDGSFDLAAAAAAADAGVVQTVFRPSTT